MVNPSKYFTNQDVQANMPIISNCLKKNQAGGFIFDCFGPAISVLEQCQCILLVSNKKHTASMQKQSYPAGKFFLYAVFILTRCVITAYFQHPHLAQAPPGVHNFGIFM